MNLGNLISRSALYWPDALAVVDRHQRLTFAQLEQRSNRLASGLDARGVERGAHVAILAANRAELVEAEIACYKSARVKVPINARLSLGEVVQVLADSCSAGLVRCRI